MPRPSRIMLMAYSGELGGMELRIAEEARLLKSAGYEPIVAVRRFPKFDMWAAPLNDDGIRTVAFYPPPFFEEWKWHRLNYFRAHFSAARFLRRERPDLVHVFMPWNDQGGSVLWLAAHCCLPAMASIRNTFPVPKISQGRAKQLAFGFQNLRGLYAVSPSALSAAAEAFEPFLRSDMPMATIVNGVDLEKFRPSDETRHGTRDRLGIAQDALVVGSVGRLSVQKEPARIIRVFARLLQQFDNAHLVLIGQGPLEAQLREQARAEGVAHRVAFAGHRANVHEWYPAFDVHLLMSPREGFGSSTIEAMACGVPAIATASDGSGDVLRGSAGGVLIPIGDEDRALAALIDLFGDPPKRRQMAAAARADVESRFSMVVRNKTLLDFYARMLGKA